MLSRIRRLGVAALVLGLSSASCGGEDGGEDGAISDAFVIPPEGTTVSVGGVELEIPAGAVSSSTTIEVAIASATSVGVEAPAGHAFAGDAVTLTPHGLQFAVPVTATIPGAAASAVLRLDDGSDTTWEILSNIQDNGDSVTFVTTGFSIYAAAATSGGGAARGIVDPPEAVGAFDSSGISFNRDTGLVYWGVTTNSGFFQLRRVQLGATLSPEIVYETASASPLELIAVGPDAVYFAEQGSFSVGRLTHDLSEVDLEWASIPMLIPNPTAFPGLVSAQHLYFAVSGQPVRVSLSTGGVVEQSPFSTSVSEYCGLTPDRTSAACGAYVLDLVNDVEVELRYGGFPLPNGPNSSDSGYFYFTPPADSLAMYRVAHGSTEPTPLADTDRVVSAAAVDGRLYYSTVNAQDVTTMDSATGAVLKTTATDHPPSEAMIAFGDYLYYVQSGSPVSRILLSDLEP